jgi:hypothetical protein
VTRKWRAYVVPMIGGDLACCDGKPDAVLAFRDNGRAPAMVRLAIGAVYPNMNSREELRKAVLCEIRPVPRKKRRKP